ncbi:MAG: hypothetical protein WDN06_14420 [Asticcacaulis sp.]
MLSRYRAVAYDLPRRCAAAYYPEANVLIALSDHDAASGTPSYKAVAGPAAPVGRRVTLPPPVVASAPLIWRDGRMRPGERQTPEETPVAFVYDASTEAVMMAHARRSGGFRLWLQPQRGA